VHPPPASQLNQGNPSDSLLLCLNKKIWGIHGTQVLHPEGLQEDAQHGVISVDGRFPELQDCGGIGTLAGEKHSDRLVLPSFFAV
jgi:hypothetical protein